MFSAVFFLVTITNIAGAKSKGRRKMKQLEQKIEIFKEEISSTHALDLWPSPKTTCNVVFQRQKSHSVINRLTVRSVQSLKNKIF